MKGRSLLLAGALLLLLAWIYLGAERATGPRPRGEAGSPVDSDLASAALGLPRARIPSAADDPVARSSAVDLQKLRILNEVLESKNDNDPRLDNELKNLSPGTKRLLRERYRELASERLNEKGTIVLLLGRNLGSPEDFQFLEEVLREPPCLSLSDCRSDFQRRGHEAFHQEAGIEVTLSYPQIVALKMDEAYYLAHRDSSPTLAALAIRNLETATRSGSLAVSNMAQDMLRRLTRG